MFHTNYFLTFEILGFIAFILIVAREIHQRNYSRLFEIISCAIFGMILEIGNTFMAHTYSYSPNFLVNLANVPVAIGLGWAVIIYASMSLSDQYNMPWYMRPFMDALTAVTLDLAMDIVAIRLGFWKWSIPLDKEWFGVPFENIVAWIFVALSFSFLIRFIRTLNWRRKLTRVLMFFSPILSYIGLMVGLTIFSVVSILPYQINNWTTLLQFRYNPDFDILFNPQVVFWKMIFFTVIITELVHIVAWSLIRYRRQFLRNFDILSFLSLTGMHLFFFIAIFTSKIYLEIPIVIVLALISLLVHLLIHFLPFLINKKTIYFFKLGKDMIADRKEQLDQIIEVALK